MDLKKNKSEEQQLIDRCKNCEPWAQKKMYELHASTMMSVCVRYVSDKEIAKDVLQDGFVKVFTKIDTYSEVGSFEGWMRRIFVTTSLEYLRRNDVLKQSANIDEYDEFIENDNVAVIDKISADDLMTCIAGLSDGYRTVFNMYAIEGYSHQEIAKVLNISENTSRSQFMRARKILQKNVQQLFNY
jgi:RNA polymerase sigma-70 factor (ECF subfamily)